MTIPQSPPREPLQPAHFEPLNIPIALQKLRFVSRVLDNFAQAPVSDRADAHQFVKELIEAVWKSGQGEQPATEAVKLAEDAKRHARHLFDLSPAAHRDLIIAINSLAALAAPTVPAAGSEPDMPAICAALGFDPTNHHNAEKCPYCRPSLAGSEQSVPAGWMPKATKPHELLDWLNRRRNAAKPVCLIEPNDFVAQAWLDKFEHLLEERKPDSYSRSRTHFTVTINWEHDSPRQTIMVFQSAIKAVNARFEGICYLAPVTPGEVS